jgi:crossover junction endodeoxyribonuclease RuvC
MKRVLGIDCGSNATGYGVIDTDGRVNRIVASGVIRTKRQAPFSDRLHQISISLRKLIETHAPSDVAVEGVFHSVNARSALQLGHVRGVALLVAAEAGLPIHEYSPLKIKSSVVGYGRAEKSQVQEMIMLLLRLDTLPPEDAADALAVAICHSHHSFTAERISRAISRIPAPPPASTQTPAKTRSSRGVSRNATAPA